MQDSIKVPIPNKPYGFCRRQAPCLHLLNKGTIDFFHFIQRMDERQEDVLKKLFSAFSSVLVQKKKKKVEVSSRKWVYHSLLPFPSGQWRKRGGSAAALPEVCVRRRDCGH